MRLTFKCPDVQTQFKTCSRLIPLHYAHAADTVWFKTLDQLLPPTFAFGWHRIHWEAETVSLCSARAAVNYAGSHLSSSSPPRTQFQSQNAYFCLRLRRRNNDNTTLPSSDPTDRQLRQRPCCYFPVRDGSPSEPTVSWTPPCWLLQKYASACRHHPATIFLYTLYYYV